MIQRNIHPINQHQREAIRALLDIGTDPHYRDTPDSVIDAVARDPLFQSDVQTAPDIEPPRDDAPFAVKLITSVLSAAMFTTLGIYVGWAQSDARVYWLGVLSVIAAVCIHFISSHAGYLTGLRAAFAAQDDLKRHAAKKA